MKAASMLMILLGAAVASTQMGCASMGQTASNAPVELRSRVIYAPMDRVFSACLDVMTASGWMIESADRASGYIVTANRTNSAIAAAIAGQHAVRYSLYVSDAGSRGARVVACKTALSAGRMGWTEDWITHRAAAKEYAELLGAIENHCRAGYASQEPQVQGPPQP